jgi:putative FmdB family regulatory protein
MPTYEYKCSACGHKFERFQSIMADPIKQCPACKKNKATRLIGTGAGLIFKGSGFYITDYRSEGYKEKAKAEAGADTKTAAATDVKPSSDSPAGTKPAEKSDVATPPKAETKAPDKTETKPAPPTPPPQAKRSSKKR